MDLFPETVRAPITPHVYSVTELTRSVRAILEESVGFVWVEGEISNYRKQSSGHQYFTLKDAQCQLGCVLFARPGSWRKEIPLADGMQVQVRGAMTVYESRGQYQLNVQLVQAGGAGLLQAKFEALKRKLEGEGLFDPARKKALPKFPAVVAIVTSPSGAALRDILNILMRRAPSVRVLISPVRVQGEGAAKEIAAAIGELNRFAGTNLPAVDVIVVSRGGGSAEDLWEFNEEIVARAIAASEVPVVSAVGHEIDFTIADFVADLRAPTPSAAAELIVPDTAELLRRLAHLEGQASRCARASLATHRSQVAYLSRGRLFAEPRQRLDQAALRIDTASEALDRSPAARVVGEKQRLAGLFAVLRQHRPDQVIASGRQQVAGFRRMIDECARQRIMEKRQRIHRAFEMLRLLSPQTILERGYTITRDVNGEVIRSIAELRTGMKIVTRLKDGEAESEVESVR